MHMPGDLTLYKIFYTVAYYGNISHAAEALYISQPAVSKSIRKLENTVGVTLFTRGTKGVTLTTEGKIFFAYIEKAVFTISEGETVLTKLKHKEQGTLTIGVSTILCKHFLLPRLKSFMNIYPDIQIKINNKTTMDTLEYIDQEAFDLGIVSCPFQLNTYNFCKLADIQDVFVAEQAYLDAMHIVRPNDIFTKCTFMLLATDNITRRYIDRYFTENNLYIKPEIEISNMDFLIEFAKIGLGVTAVIKNFIEQELSNGNLTEIPVSPPLPARAIGVIYSKKKPLSIAAQAFLTFYLGLLNRNDG